jgi:hypothetical protein
MIQNNHNIVSYNFANKVAPLLIVISRWVRLRSTELQFLLFFNLPCLQSLPLFYLPYGTLLLWRQSAPEFL